LSEEDHELFPADMPTGNPAGAGQLQGVGEQCKLVLLMLGTNNAGHRQRASDTVQGLRAVVDLIRTRMPSAHIIVSTVFPRADAQQPFVINQQANAALMGTAPPEPVFSPVQVAAMPGLVQGWPGAAISPLRPSSSPNPATHQPSALHDPSNNVFVYDLSAAFLRPGSAALSLSSDTSSLPNIDPDYFMPDLVHLAPKGYWRWAQVIMPILERHECLMTGTQA
jgi:lysophospholipase L1-like esterase